MPEAILNEFHVFVQELHVRDRKLNTFVYSSFMFNSTRIGLDLET